MFSAKDARDLKKSFTKVSEKVTEITAEIEKLLRINHDATDLFYVMDSAPMGKFTPDLLSTFQTDVVHQLMLLGYDVVWEWEGKPYVPCGLQDDNGNGEMYDFFGIVVSWGE